MKYIGIVKNYNLEKGFGFIEYQNQDIFFHMKNVINMAATSQFRVVVFKVIDSKKHIDKKEAIDVNILTLAEDFDFLFSFLQNCASSTKANFLSRLNLTELKKLFYRNVPQSLKIQSIETYEKVSEFFADFGKGSHAQKEFLAYIHSISSPDFKFKLWLDHHYEIFDPEYVVNSLEFFDTQTLEKVLKEGNESVNKAIFLSKLKSIARIDTDEKNSHVISLFDKFTRIHQSPIFLEELKQTFISISSSYYRMLNWLDGFSEYFDFIGFKPFIGFLASEKQKTYLKKIFSLLHKEDLVLTVHDITSIKDGVMDYNLAKDIKDLDGSKVDYSVNIILQAIEDLSNQKVTDISKIYEIIASQFLEATDVLEVTGFFDECAGKCFPIIKKKANDQTSEEEDISIKFHRNEKQKPFKFCEGRKAINVNTREEVLCERTHTSFWWCNNQKCYENSLKTRSYDNWEQYTLLDFLSILKLEYNPTDYEVYLGYINKANKFLKHLNCKECKSILRPAGQSKFAVNRVNRFRCSNESCEKYLPIGCKDYDKLIYISRCINKDCNDVIDSRESVKCVPEGKDQKTCGWYICNNCNACCSTDKIELRKYILEKTGQRYLCHDVGHRGRQISCNKCGHKMEESEKANLYKSRLEWFILNKDSSPLIKKSGQNQFGKWWFLLVRGKYTYGEFREKLSSYMESGFKVPNLDKQKETQLVVEGATAQISFQGAKNLKCTECNHEIDLAGEIDKFNIMKKYHKEYLFKVDSKDLVLED